MNSVRQFEAARREYGIKAWKKALYLVLATLFVLVELVLLAIPRDSGAFARWIIGPAFLAISVYVACYALRSRLIIDGSHIEARSAFGEKTAELGEIDGFRTVTTRNGSYKELCLKNSTTICLSQSLSVDDDFRAWLQQIPDLDERDRDALLQEISNNPELGSTPEERLGALRQAKAMSVVLLMIAVAAGAAVNFFPDPFRKPSAVLLALVPVAAWFLLRRSPLLYVALKRKGDPRAELSYLPMVAGFGLFVSVRGAHLVVVQPLLATSALVLAACAAAFYGVSRGPSVRSAILLIVVFCGFYAWGLVEVADTLFDRSAPTSFMVPVVGGHVSHGKSTTYYLRLAPWGPQTAETDVDVPASLYGSVSSGDVVCTSLHRGTMYAAWFTVAACPGRLGTPVMP